MTYLDLEGLHLVRPVHPDEVEAREQERIEFYEEQARQRAERFWTPRRSMLFALVVFNWAVLWVVLR